MRDPTLQQRPPVPTVESMSDSAIVVAGGTGDLGGRIARVLLDRGASVRALVRHGTVQDRTERLQRLGVETATVDLDSASEVRAACSGASCIVSALQGLRDVIVETQTSLLEAAIEAGVPRFIPSDYSIDFTRFPAGQNRNLDLRREFHERLDERSIQATTVFCGAFADLLTGQMPLLLFRVNRVLCWGNADQRMDFTTMDDTAAFVASAALDPSTPRFLRIAGDQVSARELTVIASEVTAKRFHLLRPGGLGMLSALIEIARAVAPEETELYPGLAGYAVHAQHVRRSSKAAAARQRSLSRNALDARARGDLSAPGEFLNHSGSCDEPCLCLMQPKESNTWQPVTT